MDGELQLPDVRALSGKHRLPQNINSSAKSRVTPRTGCQIYKEIKNLKEVLDDLSHKKLIKILTY
jgi:hypothetical protein